MFVFIRVNSSKSLSVDLYHRVVLGETEFMLYASTCTHNKSHDLKKKKRRGKKQHKQTWGPHKEDIVHTKRKYSFHYNSHTSFTEWQNVYFTLTWRDRDVYVCLSFRIVLLLLLKEIEFASFSSPNLLTYPRLTFSFSLSLIPDWKLCEAQFRFREILSIGCRQTSMADNRLATSRRAVDMEIWNIHILGIVLPPLSTSELSVAKAVDRTQDEDL